MIERTCSGSDRSAQYPLKTWTDPNPHGCLKEGDTPSWFFFFTFGQRSDGILGPAGAASIEGQRTAGIATYPKELIREPSAGGDRIFNQTSPSECRGVCLTDADTKWNKLTCSQQTTDATKKFRAKFQRLWPLPAVKARWKNCSPVHRCGRLIALVFPIEREPSKNESPYRATIVRHEERQLLVQASERVHLPER